jgi:hypothetical protein
MDIPECFGLHLKALYIHANATRSQPASTLIPMVSERILSYVDLDLDPSYLVRRNGPITN